jgi:hypothetical protein
MLKVGDKVKIPTKKSIGPYKDSIHECVAIREAKRISQDFLYITKINTNIATVGTTKNTNDSEFLTSDLELYVIDQLKPFAIHGKFYHIDAISKDLKELGYDVLNEVHTDKCYLVHNNTADYRKNKKNFTQLYKYDSSPLMGAKLFELPQQYGEALEFAKKQLNYFKTREVDLYLGSNKKKITINDKGGINVDGGVIRIEDVMQLHRIFTSNKMTMPGVGLWNNTFMVRIGCEGENNIFDKSDMETIMSTYRELNGEDSADA